MFNLKSIEDAGDIAGKRVLLRLDLNDEVRDGKMLTTFRLDKIIPTIDLLRQKKAKIIAFSHISKSEDNNTLRPMWDYLNGFFPVKFSATYFTNEAENLISEMNDSETILFENIRINAGEDENDVEFAKKLAAYGDIYINEAFSESHRKQASIVELPKFLPHYAGPLFINEIEHLSKAFSPKHPFLFVLGGAKFGTKVPLIKKFLNIADDVFVGGALATDIFKQKGFEIGTSLVSPDKDIKDFGVEELIQNNKLEYPQDVNIKKIDDTKEFKESDKIEPDEYIGDVGPQTLENLKNLVSKAKLILWNGPLGNYESGFTEATEQLAKIISTSGVESIVGGGDTLASIQKLDLLDKFSFVSTGGGAMLDFLANETLPGIEALINN